MDRVGDALVDLAARSLRAQREVGGDRRHVDDLRRVVALVGAADELVAQAQREDDLGGRREERDDAHARAIVDPPIRPVAGSCASLPGDGERGDMTVAAPAVSVDVEKVWKRFG